MGFLLDYVKDPMVGETVFKLILMSVLAGIIGLEREAYNKPAGFRTHVLVGLSAVLVSVCGEIMYEQYGADSSRIPAQLLSGIGFLGAGTILRDGLSVKGLTTAASLLTVTCIGMSIGAGFYAGGIIATILAFCILAFSKNISEKFEHRNSLKIKIQIEDVEGHVKEIQEILEKNNYALNEMKLTKNTISVAGLVDEDFNKGNVFYKIAEIKGVSEVKEIKEQKTGV